MKTFKSFYEWGTALKESTKDITKYSSKDLSNNGKHGKLNIVFSKFLFMDDSGHGKAASGQPKGKEEGTTIDSKGNVISFFSGSCAGCILNFFCYQYGNQLHTDRFHSYNIKL